MSAFDGSSHEEFAAANDFPRDSKFRALNDYEVTLPKSDEELPEGELYVDDSNYGYSCKWQLYITARAVKDNVLLPP